MLSTVTLAATNPIIPVWVGSTIGMVLSDGLAILVGKLLGAKLPERIVKIGAAIIFFGFGVLSIFQGGARLPYYSWVIGLLIVIVMAYFFLLKEKIFKIEKETSKEAAAGKYD